MRQSVGIWRDTRVAWTLTYRAWQAMPALFLVALALWSLVRFACLRGLGHAHLELGGSLSLAEAARLLPLAVTADLGPLVLAAFVWPPQHWMILNEPPPGRAAWRARAARMLGAVFVLALCGFAIVVTPLMLPNVLMTAIGRVSTILTLILLLPALCVTLIGLLRLSFGLPAISLGLPRPLAEGWEIGRARLAQSFCVGVLALLPLGLTLGVWLAVQPDRLGWAETLVRPVLDVVAVSLTGALTGLFYREMRLPLGLRPDVRPSWNRDMRREPIIS